MTGSWSGCGWPWIDLNMINIEDNEDGGQFLPQVTSYNFGCPYSMDDLREDLGPKVPSCTCCTNSNHEISIQQTRKVPFFPKQMD